MVRVLVRLWKINVKMRLAISILVLLTTLAPAVRSEPLNIIIVTGNAESERGYTQFLQGVYRGNVNVRIDPGRYDESLSAAKKLELESADLIIVSRDTDGKDYNADADFWNELLSWMKNMVAAHSPPSLS